MSLKKIVLTGGPCAGKSTAINSIKNYFEKLGFNVIIINESATELINSGVKPFGENKIDSFEFQKIIFDYQLMKEKIIGNSVFDNQKDTIVIHDRGIMDNKAYLEEQDFNRLLREKRVQEIFLLERYDGVIHLVTAANGAEQFYTLSNNNARTETIDEARELDLKTQLAWLGHDYLNIVTNSNDFNYKIEQTLKIIENMLKKKKLKQQKKFLLDYKYMSSLLNDYPNKAFYIEQQYLPTEDNLYRVRKKTFNNCSYYTMTLEELIGTSQKIILENHRIDEKNYCNFILDNFDNMYEIKKERIFCLYQNQYFKVDRFENDVCLMEIDSPSLNELPSSIPIIDDVTNKDNYYNFMLSKKLRNPF